MGRPKGSKNKKPRGKREVIKDWELTEFKIGLHVKVQEILEEISYLQEDGRPNQKDLQELNIMLGQINFYLLDSLS